MPETDALTRCLHELGDLGADQLRTESVHIRVQLAVDVEIEAERSGRDARRPRQVRIRISRGALVSAVCVLVAVAVVVGALTLVSGGSNRRAQPAATPGANALIARLAVLRRPQTPADRMPTHLLLSGPTHPRLSGPTGTVMPRLTRLIAQRPGVRLYLVVTSPVAQRGGPDWPAALGDQVSLIAVRGHSGVQTAPVPAAVLGDAAPLVPFPSHRPRVVQIVPDGVAHVRWSYPILPEQFHHIAVTTSVADNLAISPPQQAEPARATWLRADGTVVVGPRILGRRVVRADEAARAHTIAQALSRVHHRAPARLLDGFSVLGSPNSRGGVTVTRPHLSAIPLPILGVIYNGRTDVDVAHIRAVTVASGRSMWVLPGLKSLCLVTASTPDWNSAVTAFVDQPPVRVQCADSIAGALAHGVKSTPDIEPGGVSVAFGVLPRRHPTTTLRLPGGGRPTIRPPLGAYDLVIR
jgi:hypothetical protein